MHEIKKAFKWISLEINSMYPIDAKSEASDECVITHLNVLKPSVYRADNSLHI